MATSTALTHQNDCRPDISLPVRSPLVLSVSMSQWPVVFPRDALSLQSWAPAWASGSPRNYRKWSRAVS